MNARFYLDSKAIAPALAEFQHFSVSQLRAKPIRSRIFTPRENKFFPEAALNGTVRHCSLLPPNTVRFLPLADIAYPSTIVRKDDKNAIMFTGIITDIGKVRKAEQRGDLRLEIRCGYDMATVDVGASICCSGVCLTVVDKGEDWFAVDLSAETVSRAAQGQWTEGGTLNLERSLKLGDEMGGHIVTGHVDGIGEVVSATESGDSTEITIRTSKELAQYIAPKGSIALDGVSLTVNQIADRDNHSEFTINLIPHTADVTTFATVEAGRPVNIEIDILARYLARMTQMR